jgi:ABC-type Na+ efflux pump permease subunit
MRNTLTIAGYELKMQMKNIALWVIVLITFALTIFEQFPSEENLRRISGLSDHSYIASRSMTLTGILLMFGCAFIVGNRIHMDINKGTSEILFSAPISKTAYIGGKFLGNYLAALVMCGVFVFLNGVVQAFFNPSPFEPIPYLASFVFISVPSMLFVVGLSIGLPVLMGTKLFFTAFSAYIMYCMIIVPENYEIPFYWIIGDTRKLVFHNGSFSFPYQSIVLNVIFLMGIGIASLLLLGINNKRFWRES